MRNKYISHNAQSLIMIVSFQYYSESEDGRDDYRFSNEAEAQDIGAEDYFDCGALCFIEWPERIEGLLPDDTVRVDITVDPNDDSRTVKMTFNS